MTPAPDYSADDNEERSSPLVTVLKWASIFLLGSFALGFSVAGIENLIEEPARVRYWAIAGSGLAALALAIWFASRMIKASAAQKISKSERGSNRLLLLSGVLGGVLSLAMVVGTSLWGGSFELMSNEPVPPLVAGIVIAAWLVLMPWITIAWYRTVDEHERETYVSGAMFALHAYAVVVPAWWLAWRGGFMSEPNHMLIYLGVIAIWGLAWLWRRLR